MRAEERKKRMERMAHIARENHEMVRKGFYTAPSGKQMPLPFPGTEVILPEMELQLPETGSPSACIWEFRREDSLTSARGQKDVLVMNYANAVHPGGGYFKGSLAQEESICRQSMLYPSLDSPGARLYYRYNRSLEGREQYLGSEALILSRDVLVFRSYYDVEHLLEEPYRIGVGTLAAPDLRYAPCPPVEVYRRLLRSRLRRYVQAAASGGFRTLVLGAWGCGAFRNDPQETADAFWDVLAEEGLEAFFEKLIFTVPGREDDANVLAFSHLVEKRNAGLRLQERENR